MQTKNILRTLAAGVLVLAACKKSDTAPAVPQKTVLAKADYASVGTFVYTYDNLNRLKTETYSGNASNPATVTTVSNYDDKGRVTEAFTDFTLPAYADYKAVVSYNTDGKLERRQYYDASGAGMGYTFFEYASGKITAKRYSATNALQSSIEYSFSADGANVVMAKSFNSTGVLTLTTNYSNFDTKNTTDNLYPYGFTEIPFNKNNWMTLSRTASPSGTVTGFTTTFTYNADGYPLVRTASNGANITWEYIKK